MNTQYDSAMDRAARWIVEKRLESAAVLFLEMNKPLSFIAGQSVYFGAPILAPLLGLDRLQKAAGILSDRRNIELFITNIENLAASRRDGDNNER